MPQKIHFFDSVSSRVPIGDTEGKKNESKNLPADWSRTAGQIDCYLNGEPLSVHGAKYKFATDQDVDNFLTSEFFDKLKLPDSKKAEVLDYLKKYVHQQGFLFSVSNTIAYELIMAGNALKPPIGLTVSSNDMTEQRINITVDSEGLTIQELVEVSQLTASVGKQAQKMPPDDPATRNYVIKAEGTLHFDFKENASEPTITVQSNKISLGRADLNDILGPSSFLDKVWDFIARLCGFNKVHLNTPHTSSLS